MRNQEEIERRIRAVSARYPKGAERNAHLLQEALGPELLSRREFVQAFIKVEHKNKGGLTPLRYNRVQRDLEAWRIRAERSGQPQRVVILKSRHHGVSTLFESWAIESAVRNHLFSAGIIAQDDDTAGKLLEAGKIMRDSLPWRLPIKYDNRSILYFDEPVRSLIDIISAKSRHAGRGKHYRMLHMTEVGFWPDPENTFVALAQTVPRDPGTLLSVESTANGRGNFFYDLYMAAQEKERASSAGERASATEFTAKFYPWTWDDSLRIEPEDERELISTLDDEERFLQDHGVDLPQLNWRRWAIANLTGGMLDLFRQEYPFTPEEAFISSGRPAFSPDRVQRALRNSRPPSWKGHIHFTGDAEIRFTLREDPNGPLSIWRGPEDRTYVMGSDTAEGVRGGDNSTCCVLDITSGCQVAEWAGNELNPNDFGKVATALAAHYNNAWWLPEVNGAGVGTLHAAQSLGYNHILRQPIYGKAGTVIDSRIGWRTTVENKARLVSYVRICLSTNESTPISSAELSYELMNYQISDHSTGKGFEAPRGKRDDRIIAFALALAARAMRDDPDRPAREDTTEDLEPSWLQKHLNRLRLPQPEPEEEPAEI